MKILKTGNQPAFGIRCINSKTWNPKFLDNFEKSKLVREIDAKYPDASANCFLFKQEELGNDENIWTMLFDLALTPKKVWHCYIDSHFMDVPDKYLSDRINELSLQDLEKEIEKQTKNGINTHKIKIPDKKENIVIEFFKRIFGKNS